MNKKRKDSFRQEVSKAENEYRLQVAAYGQMLLPQKIAHQKKILSGYANECTQKKKIEEAIVVLEKQFQQQENKPSGVSYSIEDY